MSKIDPRARIRSIGGGRYVNWNGQPASEGDYLAQEQHPESRERILKDEMDQPVSYGEEIEVESSLDYEPVRGSGIPSEKILVDEGYHSMWQVPREKSDLVAIRGIGSKTAEQIIEWFKEQG